MMNINSILSGLNASRTGISSQQTTGTPPENQSLPAPSEDTFVQGEWWKNRAQPAGQAYGLHGMSAYGAVVKGRAVFDASAPFDVKQGGASLHATTGEAGDTDNSTDLEEGDGLINGPAEPEGVEPREEERSKPPAEPGATQPTKPNGEPLEPSDLQYVAELQKVDQEVRAHEAAHLAAAGGHAKGGASFTYQQGPDGNRYAVGGEVSIDMSTGATPDETISKMRIVRRAALAPADPSPQDQKVAAQATINMTEATQELRLAEPTPGNENDLKQAAESYSAKGKDDAKETARATAPEQGFQVGWGKDSEDDDQPAPIMPTRNYPSANPYTSQGNRNSSLDFLV